MNAMTTPRSPLLALLALLAPFTVAFPLTAQSASDAPPELPLSTFRRVLDNGMTVVVAPDRTVPLVAVRLLYRVGSRNEQVGATGMAHLFEHMMFNGARRFGPKRFDAVLESAGGAGNAFTTTDFTCYTTQVPPESLATVFDLESDRMVGLTIHKHMLGREVQIVLEERRQVLEDVPTALGQSLLIGSLFQAHAYRWPVLGWPSDIAATTVRACVDFHATYYAPDNAVLVLAGDVEPDAAFALVERYFGKLPRGPGPRDVVTVEPERTFATRLSLPSKAPNPTLFVGFVGPRAADPDHAAVDLLRQVLTNAASARLHRRLVQTDRTATSIAFSHGWLVDPEPMFFTASLPPGGDPAVVEAALFDEIRRLVDDGVDADEMTRARTGATASLLRELGTLGQRATTLGQFEIAVGDPRAVLALPQRYAVITGADLQRVASRFLRKDRAAVVVVAQDGGS